MVSRNRSFGRYPGTWLVLAAQLVACGQVGRETSESLSPFALDTGVSGVVLENVRACEVDAVCYLRIEFADTTVVAVYGTGERPAPTCTVSAEVSNSAFSVRPRDRVEVVISRCGDDGYHVQRLVRVTG